MVAGEQCDGELWIWDRSVSSFHHVKVLQNRILRGYRCCDIAFLIGRSYVLLTLPSSRQLPPQTLVAIQLLSTITFRVELLRTIVLRSQLLRRIVVRLLPVLNDV